MHVNKATIVSCKRNIQYVVMHFESKKMWIKTLIYILRRKIPVAFLELICNKLDCFRVKHMFTCIYTKYNNLPSIFFSAITLDEKFDAIIAGSYWAVCSSYPGREICLGY